MLTPDQEKLKEAALELRGLKWMPATEVYNDCGVRCRELLTEEGDAVFDEYCGPSNEEAAFISLANPAAILAILAQLEQVQGDTAPDFIEPEYELWQGSMVVAGTAGKKALKEAQHYAAVYSQDGPVEIVEVRRRKLPPPPEAA